MRGTPPTKIDYLSPKERKGLIVIITGNGKGKTTAALGIALRSVGYGLSVCMIQFMKGDIHAGEWDSLKLLPNVANVARRYRYEKYWHVS